MPDIGYLPEIQFDVASRRGRSVGRKVLVIAVVAGLALAAMATPAKETAQALQAAGPELTRLLRAMAGLKLMFAVGLLAAVYWRMAVPASTWRLASYAAAGVAMAAGPVLIWEMVHIRVGALLLHGGLLAAALLLWRDPAVGARLGGVVARRRDTLRAQKHCASPDTVQGRQLYGRGGTQSPQLEHDGRLRAHQLAPAPIVQFGPLASTARHRKALRGSAARR